MGQTWTAAGSGDREGIGPGWRVRAGGDVHRAVARAAADRVCAECGTGARREPAHAQCHVAGKAARRSHSHRVTGRIALDHRLRGRRHGNRKVRSRRAAVRELEGADESGPIVRAVAGLVLVGVPEGAVVDWVNAQRGVIAPPGQ